MLHNAKAERFIPPVCPHGQSLVPETSWLSPQGLSKLSNGCRKLPPRPSNSSWSSVLQPAEFAQQAEIRSLRPFPLSSSVVGHKYFVSRHLSRSQSSPAPRVASPRQVEQLKMINCPLFQAPSASCYKVRQPISSQKGLPHLFPPSIEHHWGTGAGSKLGPLALGPAQRQQSRAVARGGCGLSGE